MKRLLLILAILIGLMIRLDNSAQETSTVRKMNQINTWEKMHSKNILFISRPQQAVWKL